MLRLSRARLQVPHDMGANMTANGLFSSMSSGGS